MVMRRLLVFLAIAGLIALASCGGGGGGGGDSPPPAASVCPSGSATVTLSGTARFESVPISASNGALNYNAITARPIRGATVEVLCGTTVLATTETNASGQYSALIPPTPAVVVRVRAQMTRTGAPSWDFRVRDNTAAASSFPTYALDSPSVSGNASTTVDLLAGSGWNGSSYAATRASGPFAILDATYAALQKALSASPAQVFPALNLFWSVNNRPGSGDVTLGFIGTTSFAQGSSTTTAAMLVLGQANVDTDEFDSHVIAHEFGHYLQWAVSRDDSVGGSHSGNDQLDMRVAFSEGWGNAWSGIVFNDPIYRDSFGTSQSQGFTLNVSTPLQLASAGWYKELSVGSIIWNVNAQLGFTPLWNALTGPVRTTDGAATSAHLLAFALKQGGASSTTIDSLFSAQAIDTTAADPHGTNETNNGGIASVLPVYRQYGALGSTLTNLCVIGTAGVPNKLGNFLFVRVTIASAGNRSITLSGASGTDPDLRIFNSTFSQFAVSAVNGVEQVTVNLPAGSYVIAVEDFNLLSGQQQCFSLTIT